MSASSSALGSGLTAQSPYTSTSFGISMKNTLETSDTPGAVRISCKRRADGVRRWCARRPRPGRPPRPAASIMVPSTTLSSSCCLGLRRREALAAAQFGHLHRVGATSPARIDDFDRGRQHHACASGNLRTGRDRRAAHISRCPCAGRSRRPASCAARRPRAARSAWPQRAPPAPCDDETPAGGMRRGRRPKLSAQRGGIDVGSACAIACSIRSESSRRTWRDRPASATPVAKVSSLVVRIGKPASWARAAWPRPAATGGCRRSAAGRRSACPACARGRVASAMSLRSPAVTTRAPGAGGR